MLFATASPRRATRPGFTLVELLVAMALIVLIMSVISQAFVEGLETFRHLKAIGDLNEELRQASIKLRGDVLEAGAAANQFIDDTLRTGTPDRSAADALRLRYELICAAALDLDAGLRDVRDDTTNPVARRLMDRILDALGGIKWGASLMVQILDLFTTPPDTDG